MSHEAIPEKKKAVVKEEPVKEEPKPEPIPKEEVKEEVKEEKSTKGKK